jgi:hypothetical protein
MPDQPAESGNVAVAAVVKVLLAVLPGLNVSVKASSSRITLVKDGKPEVIDLSASVPRRMLSRISNKYGVKMEYFYHPEMCCRGTTTKQ